MAEDLRRFLVDEPILARRASAAERYARWAHRNPTIAVLGSALRRSCCSSRSARSWPRAASRGWPIGHTTLSFRPPRRLEWSSTGGVLAVRTKAAQEVALYQITGRHHVQQWLTGHGVELINVAAHLRLERLATTGYLELNTWDLATPHPVPFPIGPNPAAATALISGTLTRCGTS